MQPRWAGLLSFTLYGKRATAARAEFSTEQHRPTPSQHTGQKGATDRARLLGFPTSNRGCSRSWHRALPLSASVPVGLRRRNAGRSQHYSRCEDSGDLASHFVLHSITKLAGPLSGRTNQSNCLRFTISNVRMDTLDYSGNPERPFQVRRTIQAEGNKHRRINLFVDASRQRRIPIRRMGCVAFSARGPRQSAAGAPARRSPPHRRQHRQAGRAEA